MKLEKTVWWWQCGCNDAWTPELVTKFSWEINIRSVQETEDSSICVGLWMTCVRPYWTIRSFKIEPSYEVLSWANQSLFLALKPLNYIVRKGILKVIACNVDSKLVVKLENSLWDWLGDRYRATSTYSLFLIFNSIVRHSWRKFVS